METKSELKRSYMSMALVGGVMLCSTVLLAMGKMDTETWMTAVGMGIGATSLDGAAYSISRGMKKSAEAANK